MDYNPSYLLKRPFIGVITPFPTSRGPPCITLRNQIVHLPTCVFSTVNLGNYITAHVLVHYHYLLSNLIFWLYFHIFIKVNGKHVQYFMVLFRCFQWDIVVVCASFQWFLHPARGCLRLAVHGGGSLKEYIEENVFFVHKVPCTKFLSRRGSFARKTVVNVPWVFGSQIWNGFFYWHVRSWFFGGKY